MEGNPNPRIRWEERTDLGFPPEVTLPPIVPRI